MLPMLAAGLLGGLAQGAIGAIFGGSGESGKLTAAQIKEIEKLKQFLPPEEFARLVPEEVQARLVSEDPDYGIRQNALLELMADRGESGFSESDNASYELANLKAGQLARSRNEALLSEMAARGRLGSGSEFALRQQASQDATQRAQEANLQQAADSARQKALYQQAYGNMLGDVRGQDYQTKRDNTETINKFNLANTTARNEAQNLNIQRQMDRQQQNFNNRLNIEQAKSGQVSNAANQAAASQAATGAAVQKGLGTAMTGVLGSMGYGPWASTNDEKKKYQDAFDMMGKA